MCEDLVWARVMRPRTPLVYLDLNTIIYIARALRGASGPPGYAELYAAAIRAKSQQRAQFPLGEAHLWEIAKIADPRQRGHLADILGELSDYNYLLGRSVIAELEFSAGMSEVMGDKADVRSLALVRPTMGQIFGFVGGLKIRDPSGADLSESTMARMGGPEFDSLMSSMNYEFERSMLRGPTDEDLLLLRQDPEYRPEMAIESHHSRLLWELETKRILDADPKWRRGRLRDVIGAREIVHEWLDLFNRLRAERISAGRADFDPSDEQMRTFIGSMPHTQVAVSIKTRYHQNPKHRWTTNDISDIDAMSVAYAYCEAVFPDKAMRAAITSAKELRSLGTFVARRPAELIEWLDALPPVMAPELLVPHPLRKAA